MGCLISLIQTGRQSTTFVFSANFLPRMSVGGFLTFVHSGSVAIFSWSVVMRSQAVTVYTFSFLPAQAQVIMGSFSFSSSLFLSSIFMVSKVVRLAAFARKVNNPLSKRQTSDVISPHLARLSSSRLLTRKQFSRMCFQRESYSLYHVSKELNQRITGKRRKTDMLIGQLWIYVHVLSMTERKTIRLVLLVFM